MKQELLPKELKENLEKNYPLYSQDGKGENAKIIAHYFLGPCDWWVTEGQQEDEEFIFFGVVKLGGLPAEWGQFSLSQIEQTFNVRTNIKDEETGEVKQVVLPLHVERDEYWTEQTVSEAECFVEED